MLVKFVNPPKPGKKLGNLKMGDGTTIFYDPAKFMFTPNQEYLLELGVFGDGARIVNKVLPNAAPQVPQSITGSETSSRPAAAAPYSRTPDVSASLSEPELRFISNVVGQAILAKTITDPMEVSVWAKAAKQTLKELI